MRRRTSLATETTSGPIPSPGRRVILYDFLVKVAAAEHLTEVGLVNEDEEEEERN